MLRIWCGDKRHIMASLKLTDRVVDSLPAPETGNKRYPDPDTPNFGVTVTSSGKRSFYVRYRNRRDVDRLYTIGSRPVWITKAAREEAQRLLRAVDGGADPVADEKELRTAPTVANMCQRYEEEHLPTKRQRS